MTVQPRDVTYFATPSEFHDWLAANHADAAELWVGFHKKATGRPSLTWSEAVDEALAVGWIDGQRRRLDDERYTIRFTARRPGSVWSAVNVRRVGELKKLGRMKRPGLAAFEARDERRTPYSYGASAIALDPAFEKRLRANRAAWMWFSAQAPSYQRLAGHWIMNAKRDETRQKRLEALIEDSAHGRVIKPMSYGRKK